MSTSTCKQPPYPLEAKQFGAEGTTQLDFEVSAQGKVTRVAIVKFSGDGPGHKLLDALALETLNKCSFPAAPGFLSASSRVEYVWRLRD
jgi:TonB family protein